MTPDEFRASLFYTPEVEPVLEALRVKYGEFFVSPPMLSVDGNCNKRCKCMIPWTNGRLRMTKDEIPIEKRAAEGW